VSRTGAEVDPGLRRPEQKRCRVTWAKEVRDRRGSGGVTRISVEAPGVNHMHRIVSQDALKSICVSGRSTTELQWGVQASVAVYFS
jgi:hypothetical protein